MHRSLKKHCSLSPSLFFLTERRPRALLREILAAETRAARLPLEGTLTGVWGFAYSFFLYPLFPLHSLKLEGSCKWWWQSLNLALLEGALMGG